MAEVTVEVAEGPDAGVQIPVDRPIEVGREPGLGLTLGDTLVSRRHARITPTRGGVLVEDLGSLNGTFINGNQVHAPSFASAGDQILVGVTVIQLRSPREVAQRPSAVRPVPPALRVETPAPNYLPPDLQRAAPGAPPAGPGQGPTGPLAPVGRAPEVPVPELDPLLDVYTKRKAFIAPIGILAVAAFALMIWLALR
ncbi:MAG TPA: FHA domain-containing protein [Actinomycetota bacterium]|nr:FHA domain-containing protein [Actinomycetota bacterium]